MLVAPMNNAKLAVHEALLMNALRVALTMWGTRESCQARCEPEGTTELDRCIETCVATGGDRTECEDGCAEDMRTRE